jgi:hypothetical protein
MDPGSLLDARDYRASFYQSNSAFHRRPVYENFRDFIDQVWHNCSLVKIHQAMNLRRLVVSMKLTRSSSLTGSSDVLEFVDLMHLFFPLLGEVRVYLKVSIRGSTAPASALKVEEKEFTTKKNVISLTNYEEVKEGNTIGAGFECYWLGKDGKKRYFLMEESLSGDWVPKGRQA